MAMLVGFSLWILMDVVFCLIFFSSCACERIAIAWLIDFIFVVECTEIQRDK